MHLSEHILTKNDCYRAGRIIVPKGILIHATKAVQPDVEAILRAWNQPEVDRCPHALVSREGVIETLPWNWRGRHAGTPPDGVHSADGTHISIELLQPAEHIWEDGKLMGYSVEKNASYFAAIYQNAAEVCAYLCTRYSLDPMENLVDHTGGEALGIAPSQGDVAQWFFQYGKSMERLRADVKALMVGGGGCCINQEQFNTMFETAMAAYLNRQEERPVSPWAATAWNRALAGGIFDGAQPGGSMTREQAALVLDRLRLIR